MSMIQHIWSDKEIDVWVAVFGFVGKRNTDLKGTEVKSYLTYLSVEGCFIWSCSDKSLEESK